ncbi:olfactory receptor 4P4-like [Odontesthes bonariensis]
MFTKHLHEPMYIFIAALLLNSVLFSTVVFPKLLIDLLSERQIISHSPCFFQHFMFYSLGPSELLLLTAMAFDQYVSICKPLHDKKDLSMKSEFSKTLNCIMSLQIVMNNPLFNPIIYGLKMKEIYKQLKKLLCSYKIN